MAQQRQSLDEIFGANNSTKKKSLDEIFNSSSSFSSNMTPMTLDDPGKGGLAGVGVGAAKGAGSTASSLGKIGLSLLDNTVGRVGNAISGKGFTKPQNNIAAEEAIAQAVTPQSTAEKIGFGAEQIGEFFIPGGAVAKAGKYAEAGVDALKLTQKGLEGAKAIPAFKGAGLLEKTLNLGSKSVIGAGEAAGITGLQGGDSNQIKNAAKLGFAFPVGLKAIGVLGSGAKEVAKTMTSGLSGVPKAAMEQAFKNPKAVQSAISRAIQEGGDVFAQKINDDALEALSFLKKARSTAYESDLLNVEKTLMKTKNGQLYVKRTPTAIEAKMPGYKGGDVWFPTDLSLKGLKNVASKTIKEFGGNAKGKTLDLTEMAIDKTHAKKLQELVDEVYAWKNLSPTGIEKLVRKISSYKLGGVNLGSSEKQFNAIVSKLKHNAADYLGERVPAIRTMRSNYAKQSEVIDNIVNQLKLGKGDPNTALRKLVNVFNPKSEVYKPIVQELGEKAGIDLMSDIAGLTMSKWGPEGLSKYLTGALSGGGVVGAFVNPATLAASIPAGLASSPRLVGKTITTLGKASKSKALPVIKKATSRAALGTGIQVLK
jgi:hypothetical protein